MKFDKLINEIKAQHIHYQPLNKDSDVIFDNDKIKIVQIYTEAGLKKYAQHTKWLNKATVTTDYNDFSSINYIKRLKENQHLGWNLFVIINKEIVGKPNAKMIFYISQTESLSDTNMVYDSLNEDIDYKEVEKLLVDNHIDKEKLGILDATSYNDVLSKIQKKVPLDELLQNEHADMIFQSGDEMQILAIDNYKNAVKFITQPSLGVQLYAVKKDGMNVIPLMQNGVELIDKVKLAAVRQNGMSLEHMFEPFSPDVLMAAVQQNGHVIGVIIDRKLSVDKQLMIAAVTESGSAIESIIDAGIVPTPNLIKIAIANKHNPISLQEVNSLIRGLQNEI